MYLAPRWSSACSGSSRRSASSSRRCCPLDVISSQGWWKIFTKPSLADLGQLPRALRQRRDHRTRCWTTLWIALGGDGPADPHRLARRATPSPGSSSPAATGSSSSSSALLVVPLQMALIPIFTLYNDARPLRHDARPRSSSTRPSGCPFAIFLLRNFFVGIPKDLLEAARIDGASELRIFFRLILPLGLPAIASLAIFQFLWAWNDLLVALTFGRDTQPITVAIFSQLRQFGVQHRADRAGLVRLAGHPAGRLLRLPALLRAGPAGRLGQVGRRRRPGRRAGRAGGRVVGVHLASSAAGGSVAGPKYVQGVSPAGSLLRRAGRPRGRPPAAPEAALAPVGAPVTGGRRGAGVPLPARGASAGPCGPGPGRRAGPSCGPA